MVSRPTLFSSISHTNTTALSGICIQCVLSATVNDSCLTKSPRHGRKRVTSDDPTLECEIWWRFQRITTKIHVPTPMLVSKFGLSPELRFVLHYCNSRFKSKGSRFVRPLPARKLPTLLTSGRRAVPITAHRCRHADPTSQRGCKRRVPRTRSTTTRYSRSTCKMLEHSSNMISP